MQVTPQFMLVVGIGAYLGFQKGAVDFSSSNFHGKYI
jgi:hypothetical protein